MVSAFLRVEGESVRNRLWSFLIVHSEYDYSMRDIAKFSEVSYTSLKEIWKDFVHRGLVIHTRNVGKAKMYKLNRNNAQVDAFIEYYWTVVDAVANKEIELERKQKALKHSRRASESGNMSMPLSASRL